MPRRPCCRRVLARPGAALFKPAGIPMDQLETVELTLDGYEAIRLADHEGLYQEEAAQKMGISRPTFSRLLASARGLVAQALVHGKALVIEGGPVHVAEAAQHGRRRERKGHGVHLRRCPRCGDEVVDPVGEKETP